MESDPIGPEGRQKWIGIRMADSPRNPGNAGERSSVRAVGSAGRRRLLQAGISAAPVVMTVLSRPVLAQAGNCQSPSGFVSGNASNPGMNMCYGKAPTYWVTQTPWPAGLPDLNPPSGHVKVYYVFGGTDHHTTLRAVLGGGNADPKALIAAAYLNIRNSPPLIPPAVLGLPQVQHMWTEFAATYGYTPSTGAHWSPAELVDYLQRIEPNLY